MVQWLRSSSLFPPIDAALDDPNGLLAAGGDLSPERLLDAYREAFSGFDPAKVARFDRRRIDRLLTNTGIVRNRLKIESTVSNARAFLELQREAGSFDRFVWSFVGGSPKINRWRSLRSVPASTRESDALSDALKRRGFRFVGSTICYAFMQATGLVNDHLVTCDRYGVTGSVVPSP